MTQVAVPFSCRPLASWLRGLLATFMVGFGMASLAQGTASVTVDRNPVTAGQPFRITFEFQDARVDFQSPPQIDGIRYLNGPSQSNSTQIINGSMTSKRSYTYTAVAARAGLIQIPSLTFNSKSGPLRTRAIALRVAEAGSSAGVGKPAFFAAIEANKASAHIGEPVRVQYRIYNRMDAVDVRSYTFPDLSGVWRETVEGEDPRWENTVLDGQRYQVATLRTDLLYPTRAGELLLEGFDVDAQSRISFFNTRPLAASAPPVTIAVTAVPGTPPSPSVGTYSGLKMRWSAAGQNPRKANEAINVTLEFSGQGNLSLLGAPDIDWPADIEVFDPDITDRIRTTAEGQGGKRTYTYLIIPRAEGQYELALPPLSYYDFTQDRFVRLSAPVLPLVVEGNAQQDSPAFGFNSKSDVTILTRDVRFIRTETELRPKASRFFGGPLHLLLWAFPPLALLVLSWMKRGRARADRNPEEVRRKQARKALKEVIQRARKGLADLDEIGPAIHRYLQAQLGLSQSASGSEAYRKALDAHGSPEVTTAWLDIVAAVDRGRFAPGAPEPSDLAGRVEAAMAALERTGSPSVSAGALALLLILGSQMAMAAPDPVAALLQFQEGNVAYTEGNYDAAVDHYQAVAENWTSFELEYNLGGAHYKAGNIGPCILHYERARQLRPNDDDLNANLLLAQSSVTDRIEGMPEIGMASLWRELISEERLAGWTAASLFLWFLGFGLLGWRLRSREVARRRVLGLTAPALLLLALAVGALSKQTHERIVSEDGAVVMVPRVEVKGAPAAGPDTPNLFILHEGTVVEVLRTQDGWTRVRLSNGNTGWLDAGSVEAI